MRILKDLNGFISVVVLKDNIIVYARSKCVRICRINKDESINVANIVLCGK